MQSLQGIKTNIYIRTHRFACNLFMFTCASIYRCKAPLHLACRILKLFRLSLSLTCVLSTRKGCKSLCVTLLSISLAHCDNYRCDLPCCPCRTHAFVGRSSPACLPACLAGFVVPQANLSWPRLKRSVASVVRRATLRATLTTRTTCNPQLKCTQ